jgi:hypothetical protein
MRKWRGSSKALYILTWKTENFLALKVSRQCPLILLLEVCWREGKELDSEEGNVLMHREEMLNKLFTALDWGRMH